MEKKTKLTISGGIAKKSIKNIDKTKNQGSRSVIIEKKSSKFSPKGKPFKSGFAKINSGYNNKGGFNKPNFNQKTPTPIRCLGILPWLKCRPWLLAVNTYRTASAE